MFTSIEAHRPIRRGRMPLNNVAKNNSVPMPVKPTNDVAPKTRKYFPETWIWNCMAVRFVVLLLDL